MLLLVVMSNLATHDKKLHKQNIMVANWRVMIVVCEFLS